MGSLARPERTGWWFHLVSLLGTPPGLLLLVILVGTLDLVTTWEVPLGLFYLVPITLVASFHTWRRVQLAVALSVAAWALVDLGSGRPMSHPVIPLVNALIRTLMLGGMGWFIFSSRRAQARERDLVAFVLHDLRNPVTAMGLALEGLADPNLGLPRDQGVAQGRYAMRRMQCLLDSLLELTRLEQGQARVRREPVLLSHLVEAAATTFHPLLAANQVSLELAVVPGTRVLGDGALLQRVVENLLANAIKVSAVGTTIRVACQVDGTGGVRLRVTDQGPGIPETMVRKIFDPYVQLELNRQGQVRGTGLGLAFCRVAVRGMGGRIWAENPKEGGASLVVALQAPDAQAARVPVPSGKRDAEPPPPLDPSRREGIEACPGWT